MLSYFFYTSCIQAFIILCQTVRNIVTIKSKRVYIGSYYDEDTMFTTILLILSKAMPNLNFVKRQLKIDKPRYLFTKTHKPKTKTQLFYDKNNAFYIYIS